MSLEKILKLHCSHDGFATRLVDLSDKIQIYLDPCPIYLKGVPIFLETQGNITKITDSDAKTDLSEMRTDLSESERIYLNTNGFT